MQKIVAAFNIPPGIILNELQTSELMRYSNAVNDMDLFTAACKYSNRGPSSLGERKNLPRKNLISCWNVI